MRFRNLRRGRHREWMISVLLLLSAAAAWLWAHEGHAPLPSKGAQVDVARGLIVLSRESRDALDVQTAEVENGSIPESVLAYATLAAPWQRHGFASSRLPGRIAAIHAQSGQRVRAGDVLAEVQSLDLENLQIELLNAQNELRLAEQLLKMLNESSDTVSGQQVLDARGKLQQAQNALDVAKVKWLNLGLTAESVDALLHRGRPSGAPLLPVRCPVAGTVSHADLNVGKVIEPGEHLFEVVDLTTVWAKIGVLERDLHRVKVGQPVELRLTAYPGETFASTIRVKGLAFDPQSNLNTVWAELANPPGKEPRLLPGMTGQARIGLPSLPAARRIPASALINDGVERYVLVETANTEQASEYQKTPVAVRRQTSEWAEVEAGSLYPGTRVVTRGAHELGDFFVPGVLRVSPETAKTIGVKIEPADRHVVEEVVSVDGAVDVLPDRRGFASARFGGNIVRIHAEVGQQVNSGDVLAEVVGVELQNLQLDLLKEELAFQLSDRQYQDLKKAGPAVSQRKLLELEGERNATRNRRDGLRRRLESVGLLPAQIDGILQRKQLVDAVPVRSPVDGYVVHFDKAIGQAVKAEEPLFEIHDLSRPLVQLFLSERDLPQVRIGQAARIRFAADPATVFSGKVARRGGVIAAGGQTLSVWVEMAQMPAELLRYNQLASVTLTVRQPSPVLSTPRDAVLFEGTRAFVFVQNADGTFDRRAIDTGRSDDRYIEVRGGLQAGEAIAVSGAGDLWTAYSSLR